MTMIDRYLIWLYIRVLLLSFSSLAGLLVIINLFSNLDDFIEYGKREGNLSGILVQYYAPFLLSIFERLCGLLSMMAVLFVRSNLSSLSVMTSAIICIAKFVLSRL